MVDRKNKIGQLGILFLTPIIVVYAYYFFRPESKGTANTILLVIISVLFLVPVIKSFLASPLQFLVALFQFIRYRLAVLMAFFLRLINIFRALFNAGFRFIVLIIVWLLYLISPIDIVPDVLFPFGFIDDGALTAYAFYRISNVAVSIEIKRKAKELLTKYKRVVKFP